MFPVPSHLARLEFGGKAVQRENLLAASELHNETEGRFVGVTDMTAFLWITRTL